MFRECKREEIGRQQSIREVAQYVHVPQVAVVACAGAISPCAHHSNTERIKRIKQIIDPNKEIIDFYVGQSWPENSIVMSTEFRLLITEL